jgi:hypothetical protein
MKRKYLLTILIALLLATNVSAGITSTLSTSDGTDWVIWILSGVIGLLLVFYSLNVPTSQAEAELDLIVALMALVPIAFCAWNSWNIERVVGPTEVIIYSYPTIGYIFAVLFIGNIANLVRILALFRLFTEEKKTASIQEAQAQAQTHQPTGNPFQYEDPGEPRYPRT